MTLQGGFRFGPWQVSPLTGEIESDGPPVHLEPKVMEVLLALAENAGSVVRRDQLLDRVWGPRAEIADEPLNRCVAQLRKALGDPPRDPVYIKTIPKIGYQFLKSVTPLESEAAPATHAETVTAQASLNTSFVSSPPRRWQAAALAAAVVVVALVSYRVSPLLFGAGAAIERIEDYCDIERYEAPYYRPNPDAVTHCRTGLANMQIRREEDLLTAIGKFETALALDPDYGSAKFNLARAYVLYETYSEAGSLPGDCDFGDAAGVYTNCFDAAQRLLEANAIPYIERYTFAIRGYIFLKQGRYAEAAGRFTAAQENVAFDADMWQWLSQFHASVGNLEEALDAIYIAYELERDSGAILDRRGVLLMWLNRPGDMDEARRMFAAARATTYLPYQPSELVFSVREGDWDRVSELLQAYSDNRRQNVEWVDEFVAALQDPADAEKSARGMAAVERAIAESVLTGQYVYGAWALLRAPEKAIQAARALVRNNVEGMDEEFLFTDETYAMRQHDDFGLLLEDLGLDVYWAANPSECPELFSRDDEKEWCVP